MRALGGCSSMNTMIYARREVILSGGATNSPQLGFGRIHGPDGLGELTYAKAIARQRFTPVMALRSLQRTQKMDAQPAQLMTLLHSGSSTVPKPVKIERRKRGLNRG